MTGQGRDPRVLGARVADDDAVEVIISYNGLKSQPVDCASLNERQALFLVGDLIQALKVLDIRKARRG